MQFLEKMHMKKLKKVMVYKNYDIDHNIVIRTTVLYKILYIDSLYRTANFSK